MLERQGNEVRGRTQRWQALLKTITLSLIALPFGAPVVLALCLDGPRDFNEPGFYLAAILAIPAFIALWAAVQFGVRKLIQPDELVLTTSGMSLTRFGQCETGRWDNFGEPRIHSSGGRFKSYTVAINTPFKQKIWHIKPEEYGCHAQEIVDIMASARNGELIASVDWSQAHWFPRWSLYIKYWIIVLPLAGTLYALLKHHR